MRLVAVALTIVALMTPLQAAARANAPVNGQDYIERILVAANSGDERAMRTVFSRRGQHMSDQMFGALAKTLGGAPPELALADSLPDGEHGSATIAANRINLDPLAYEGLIDEYAPAHSGAVNGMPHEMAHLRQTPAILASLADREGGAQAFADDVSPIVAAAAQTYYDRTRNYDGSYAPYVTQARSKGRDWLYGGQFAHAPVFP